MKRISIFLMLLIVAIPALAEWMKYTPPRRQLTTFAAAAPAYTFPYASMWYPMESYSNNPTYPTFFDSIEIGTGFANPYHAILIPATNAQATWIVVSTNSSGRINHGYRFDQVDDYAWITRNTGAGASTQHPLNTSSNFTLMVTLRPQKTTRGDILTIWSDGGGTDKFNLLQGVSAGKFSFYVSGAGADAVVCSNAFATNTWITVCATFEGATKTMKIYTNGVYDNQKVYAGNIATNSGNIPLMISGFGGAQLFFGDIADVRIAASNVMTAAEIQTYYNAVRAENDTQVGY